MNPTTSERIRNNNSFFLSLFFHTGSLRRRLKWAVFIPKSKKARTHFGLCLIVIPYSFAAILRLACSGSFTAGSPAAFTASFQHRNLPLIFALFSTSALAGVYPSSAAFSISGLKIFLSSSVSGMPSSQKLPCLRRHSLGAIVLFPMISPPLLKHLPHPAIDVHIIDCLQVILRQHFMRRQ